MARHRIVAVFAALCVLAAATPAFAREVPTRPPLAPPGGGEPEPGFGTGVGAAVDPALEVYRDPDIDPSRFSLDPDAFEPELIDEALRFTLYEIALLEEMGAFVPNTPWADDFAAIRDAFAVDIGSERGDLLTTFTAVDQQLAALVPRFEDGLRVTEGNVLFAIGELPNEMADSLARGGTGGIVGFEYASTVVRLLGTEAVGSTAIGELAGSLAGPDLAVALADVVAQLEIAEDLNTLLRLEIDQLRDAVSALSTERDLAARSDSSPPVLTIVLVVVVGLAAAVIGWLWRRRRIAGHTVTTTQRLAGAKTPADVAAIISDAGETLVGAPARLLRVTERGLEDVTSGDTIAGSALMTAVADGRSMLAVLENDPAFPGRDRSVVAVPVTADGRVIAVITAHRAGNEPFGTGERELLEPLGPAVAGALARALELDTMSRLALVDGLTSLANRRRLDGDLETSLTDAVRTGAPIGFAMIDVDHFKTYNDTHGHGAGDDVLRTVAATIAASVRGTDVVYRYGGEEFSVLLPGATSQEAGAVAERVRAAVEAADVPGEASQPGGRLTVSIGVVSVAEPNAEVDLKKRADTALYEAKAAGRNQVVVA